MTIDLYKQVVNSNSMILSRSVSGLVSAESIESYRSVEKLLPYVGDRLGYGVSPLFI